MSQEESAAALTLEMIRRRISAHRPRLEAKPEEVHLQAAVALVLHEPAAPRAPELLFIERAEREGDPWSGQMALPGGRMHPEDPDLGTTAMRETAEEVGIELVDPIGRLDDLAGSRNPQATRIVVSPYVYEVRERPELKINYEVQSTVWIPIPWMLSAESAIEYRFEHGSFGGSFPALSYSGYTVWGLTYRVLGMFFEVLGRELPSHDGRLAGEDHPK